MGGASAAEAPKAAPVSVKEHVTLSAKVLFNFDKATLRPDAKSQVTCRYENGKVVGIDHSEPMLRQTSRRNAGALGAPSST